MSKNTPKSAKDKNKGKVESQSRLFPVLLAGLFCLIIAVTSGYGAWFLFGQKSNGKENREKLLSWGNDLTGNNSGESKIETPNLNTEPTPLVVQATPTPEVKVEETPIPTPTETPSEEKNEVIEAIEGTVLVEGGVVEIGGEQGRPVKKEVVDSFYIAETEVTNSQYAEFLKATGKNPPPGWKNSSYPKGMDNFPVVGISFADAKAFCVWLSKKMNAEVRLPTESEWERAARGDSKNKYPWGNEWDKKATVSIETGGKISKVKNSEINKSQYGAFDMVGNVWEWTSSQITEANGKPIRKEGESARAIKGGSANDKKDLISTTSTSLAAESTKSSFIGFRFVVVNKE
jgi:toxoflavin biosynthesis protein ToxD